jgi:hypothetical protein
MNIKRKDKFLKFEEEYCNLLDDLKLYIVIYGYLQNHARISRMPYSRNTRKKNLKTVEFQYFGLNKADQLKKSW